MIYDRVRRVIGEICIITVGIAIMAILARPTRPPSEFHLIYDREFLYQSWSGFAKSYFCILRRSTEDFPIDVYGFIPVKPCYNGERRSINSPLTVEMPHYRSSARLRGIEKIYLYKIRQVTLLRDPIRF